MKVCSVIVALVLFVQSAVAQQGYVPYTPGSTATVPPLPQPPYQPPYAGHPVPLPQPQESAANILALSPNGIEEQHSDVRTRTIRPLPPPWQQQYQQPYQHPTYQQPVYQQQTYPGWIWNGYNWQRDCQPSYYSNPCQNYYPQYSNGCYPATTGYCYPNQGCSYYYYRPSCWNWLLGW